MLTLSFCGVGGWCRVILLSNPTFVEVRLGFWQYFMALTDFKDLHKFNHSKLRQSRRTYLRLSGIYHITDKCLTYLRYISGISHVHLRNILKTCHTYLRNISSSSKAYLIMYISGVYQAYIRLYLTYPVNKPGIY